MERRYDRDHCPVQMSRDEPARSAELEEVRELLFPHLSPEEGWRRIDAALERADDAARANRVEELAEDATLGDELLHRIRQLRDDQSA